MIWSMGRGLKVLLLIIFAVSILPVQVLAADSLASNNLLITEIKTGGPIEGQPTEFVRIDNNSDDEVSLEGVVLEYAKISAVVADCGIDWKSQDSSSAVKTVELEGVLSTRSSLFVEMSMNDNAGGSLHLIKEDSVFDTVGWGLSVSQGVCVEGVHAETPEKGKSIKRYVNSDGFVDTDDNSKDFAVSAEPLAGEFPVVEDEEEVDEPEVPQEPVCEGVVLSEVLPNPSGSDTGNEYIEIYNPTNEDINLAGCSIKVGNSEKALEDIMGPGYLVIYGITLPNAAGGQVELISANTEEVVIYPADLKDDEAWADVEGTWQITNQPTPGKANLASRVEVVAAEEESALEPCPEGKFRNPETNRCKNIESEEGLKPCDTGQFRNPETNRCKSIASSISELKPCDEGQYRNPETNRCRKISSDGSNLKPCDEGEERSAETNRCRKVAGVSTDIPSEPEQNSSNVNLILVSLFVATAVFYGIYEYRDSIGNALAKLKGKATK